MASYYFKPNREIYVNLSHHLTDIWCNPVMLADTFQPVLLMTQRYRVVKSFVKLSFIAANNHTLSSSADEPNITYTRFSSCCCFIILSLHEAEHIEQSKRLCYLLSQRRPTQSVCTSTFFITQTI